LQGRGDINFRGRSGGLGVGGVWRMILGKLQRLPQFSVAVAAELKMLLLAFFIDLRDMGGVSSQAVIAGDEHID